MSVFQSLPQAWTAYTPTWTNITVGNGTSTGSYVQIGKTVYWRCKLIWGSTTSCAGTVSVSLPITSVAYGSTYNDAVGIVLMNGAGVLYMGQAYWTGTTSAELDCQAVTGSFVKANAINATQPFTWTTGSIISAEGFYEAA